MSPRYSKPILETFLAALAQAAIDSIVHADEWSDDPEGLVVRDRFVPYPRDRSINGTLPIVSSAASSNGR